MGSSADDPSVIGGLAREDSTALPLVNDGSSLAGTSGSARSALALPLRDGLQRFGQRPVDGNGLDVTIHDLARPVDAQLAE